MLKMFIIGGASALGGWIVGRGIEAGVKAVRRRSSEKKAAELAAAPAPAK